MSDPKFRGVLLRALGLTVALLVSFVAAVSWLLYRVIPGHLSLPWIGDITFLNDIGSGLGGVLGLVLSAFLMVPVASMFVGVFLEQIAAAVEAKHYPGLPPASVLKPFDMVLDSLRFFGVFLLVNLLASLVYLIFAPAAPVIFWLVNGWLLGREYFQVVATRRTSLKEANRLRKKHRFAIWTAGTLMTVPLTIPLLGVIVPILGVATFTHQFHRLKG